MISNPNGDAAPHLVNERHIPYLSVRGFQIAGLVLFTLFDVALAKGTFDLVFDLPEEVTSFLAVLILVGAVYTAIEAGFHHRQVHAQGKSWTPVVLVAVGWAAIGAGLFITRYFGTDWVSTGPLVEGQTAAVDASAVERAFALVMALIYIASGALGFLVGGAINLTAQGHFRDGRRLTTQRRKFNAELANLAYLGEIVESRRRDVHSQPLQLDATRLEDASLADQLKREARKQIAILLGDPASTGIVRVAPVDVDLRGLPRRFGPTAFPGDT